MNKSKKMRSVLLIVVAIVLIVSVTTVIMAKGKDVNIVKKENKERTEKVGNKEKSKNKVKKNEVSVVPTLIDPVIKDTCWCGTFQLVWNDMKNKLVHGDVVFSPQIKMVENLNKETFKEDMISEDYYYKVYAPKTLELKKQIEKEIKRKFNQESDILDDFDWSEDASDKGGDRFFFYTMLYRKFEFLQEFDKLGKSSFGKDGKDAEFFGINAETNDVVGNQIEVLFYNSEDDFAIVLKTKENDEVIFYKNPQGKTFMDIYNDMNKKADLYDGSKSFREIDIFKAPCLKVNIKKKYEELMNKLFVLNNGLGSAKIKEAIQTVKFSLDEKGGEVKSEAAMDLELTCMLPNEQKIEKIRYFLVDDTFTLFLREEGKDMPYFAMNVDDISKFQ